MNKAHISQPICSAVQLGPDRSAEDVGRYAIFGDGPLQRRRSERPMRPEHSFESAMAIAYVRGQAVIEMKKKYPRSQGFHDGRWRRPGPACAHDQGDRRRCCGGARRTRRVPSLSRETSLRSTSWPPWSERRICSNRKLSVDVATSTRRIWA